MLLGEIVCLSCPFCLASMGGYSGGKGNTMTPPPPGAGTMSVARPSAGQPGDNESSNPSQSISVSERAAPVVISLAELVTLINIKIVSEMLSRFPLAERKNIVIMLRMLLLCHACDRPSGFEDYYK